MKQLTIRGVDDRLHAALSEAAAHEKQSVNKYVLKVLCERLGLLPDPDDREATYDDLDHLAGTWTKEQGEAFLHEVGRQREIDPGLWE